MPRARKSSRPVRRYYLAPGHNIVVEEDCERVEFSPQHDYERTLQAIARNMEAAQTTPP